jgi:hypothetical protein
MKKVIRLTEGDLHRIVKESVKRVLKEQELYYSTDPNIETKMSKTTEFNINGIGVKVIDNVGLSEKEKKIIADYSMELSFDFIKYADEIEINVKKTDNAKRFGNALDIVVSGMSEDDERGNGYFGYTARPKELLEKMQEY